MDVKRSLSWVMQDSTFGWVVVFPLSWRQRLFWEALDSRPRRNIFNHWDRVGYDEFLLVSKTWEYMCCKLRTFPGGTNESIYRYCGWTQTHARTMAQQEGCPCDLMKNMLHTLFSKQPQPSAKVSSVMTPHAWGVDSMKWKEEALLVLSSSKEFRQIKPCVRVLTWKEFRRLASQQQQQQPTVSFPLSTH